VKLIVGLGNPGKKYDRTRHNIGFVVLDRLAEEGGVAIVKEKHQALIGEWSRGGEKILLVKPQTYMNLSGQALQSLLSYNRVEAEDVVVIHDDLDLPFGRIRIRRQGSAGGHRGMISIGGVLPAAGGRARRFRPAAVYPGGKGGARRGGRARGRGGPVPAGRGAGPGDGKVQPGRMIFGSIVMAGGL